MNLNPSICGLGAECDASEGALRGVASCARVGIDCVVDTDAARRVLTFNLEWNTTVRYVYMTDCFFAAFFARCASYASHWSLI